MKGENKNREVIDRADWFRSGRREGEIGGPRVKLLSLAPQRGNVLN